MDPTGNSYMEGYYSDYDAEGESGDDDAEEEDDENAEEGEEEEDENAEEGEEEEPDLYQDWHTVYGVAHPDNNDDPRHWGRHWQTWGGGSLAGNMGGVVRLRTRQTDQPDRSEWFTWTQTLFGTNYQRIGEDETIAYIHHGTHENIQVVPMTYDLRVHAETAEVWFEEVLDAQSEATQPQEEEEEAQEQEQEQEQEEDAPSEQSDFDFGFTMSKEAMEDALDTLLEERGAPHLTPQAWDEIKHAMRNWIDNTIDDGLVEAVRDLLQERWAELMNPLILQTVAVELVGDGETRPTRTFTIKTPYLPLPTFRLRCLLDATVVEVKVGLANYIMEHLHPERPIDGDMMLFRQPRVDNRGADGEMSTMRAFGERDAFTLEVDYPEFPSFVQVEQGRVARDLQLNFVPNETTTEDPPTTVATAGTPPAESEDDSADSADYTEFLEIFRV